MSSIELSFRNPWLLLAMIPALAITIIPFFLLPRKRRGTFKKIAPVVIHSVVVCILVLILAGFNIIKNVDNQAVMILVDLSDSTADFHKTMLDSAEEIMTLLDDDKSVGVLTFAENSVYSVELGKNTDKILNVKVNADATDIASALEYAASLMPTDKQRRIILISDGKETVGDVRNTAYYLATQGIRIDAAYFDTTVGSRAEVQICSVKSPENSYAGDELTFTVELKSNVDGNVTLDLYDNGTLVNSTDVYVDDGGDVYDISTDASSGGIHEFRLEISADGDATANNNTWYSFVNIAGESTVLIVADTISEASQLETLLSESCDVKTVTSQGAPTDMVEMCNYDEIILLNVDYNDLPDDFAELLKSYVSENGRSLLTIGGENTYMLGNMEETVVEEMMPVTLSLSDDSSESVAMILILDCSSSMVEQSGTTFLSLAKQGALQCVEAMTSNDYIGIISFSAEARIEANLTLTTDENKERLSRTISAIQAGKGTYYSASLYYALRELRNFDAPVKHVIFLSDGSPRDGGHYDRVINDMVDNGITLSTIGLVDTSSKIILSRMARLGGGEFNYVASAEDLPDIMKSEAERVVVDSRIEGKFTPVISEASTLTAEIDGSSIPAIYGYLGTTLKEDATAYLSTDEGHPIYAAWQYGEGTVASFMSDLSGEWSKDWLRSDVGLFITSQMVATTIDPVHSDSSLVAEISVQDDSAHIIVNTLAAVTDHNLTATVSTDSGSETYDLAPTGVGVYEAVVKADETGVYEVTIVENDENNAFVDSLYTAFATSYSAEYDAFAESGKEKLSAACSYSDGIVTGRAQSLADIEMERIEISINPLTVLSAICAVLMLADIAIRKIRWKDIKNYFLKFKAGLSN